MPLKYSRASLAPLRCAALHSSIYLSTQKSCNSLLYHTYNLNATNSFFPLAGIDDDNSVFLHSVRSQVSVFEPYAHSSPNLHQDPSRLRWSSASDRIDQPATCHPPPNPRLGDNIRAAVINANKGKRCEIVTFCHTVDQDIMIVSEIKQENSANSCEFLPMLIDWTGMSTGVA